MNNIAKICLALCYIVFAFWATQTSPAYANEAESHYKRALQHAEGEGVPRDMREAVNWFRKAAEQGYTNAQLDLGWCYAEGEGVPKDMQEAANWFRKAAEQGQTLAQYNLAYCYRTGEGVPKDMREAVIWYRKAAEQGLAQAQYNLAYGYRNGEGVPKDVREAANWYRKAAEQGHALAQFNLAFCYRNGEGLPKNTVLAYAYFLLYKTSGGDIKDALNWGAKFENTLTHAQKTEAQKQARLMWEKIETQRAGVRR